MKKKALVLCLTSSMLVLSVGAVLGLSRGEASRLKAEPEMSHMELSAATEVYAKEEGAYHQVDIRNNKIDLVGYEASSGNLGSIKKAEHGSYEYNGMVYNRSAINGFKTLTVNYTGGTLKYVLSDFLMENMNFDGDVVTSGDPIEVPGNKAYFIVYNESETKVDIESMDIGYLCNHSIDSEMINWNGNMGGARSYAKRTTEEDSFYELENNPTKTTNNYSTGSHDGHNSSWYRFNGRYLSDSDVLGTEFTFGMTIAGEYSKMTDPSENFHYGVWPQFDYGNAKDRVWIQTYIGNDNYEPLGKDHALRPSDPYTKEAYSGRFFTRYGPCGEFALWSDSLNKDIQDEYGNILEFTSQGDAEAYIVAHSGELPSDVEVYEEWKFFNPDTKTIAGNPDVTLRQAYDAYTLPFWFVKFHVYLDPTTKEAMVDVFINGFHIYTEQIFENYDTVNTPSIKIYTLPMHVVNYGIDAEGNPDESYTGVFTKPRLIENAK